MLLPSTWYVPRQTRGNLVGNEVKCSGRSYSAVITANGKPIEALPDVVPQKIVGSENAQLSGSIWCESLLPQMKSVELARLSAVEVHIHLKKIAKVKGTL